MRIAPSAARLVTLLLFVFPLLGQAMAASVAPPAMVNQYGRPSLAPMLKKVMPAVVNISTRSHINLQLNPLFNDPFFRRFFNVPEVPRQQARQSLGSGVVVNAREGYILTNNHVIANADEITVTLHDKRQFEARLMGADPEADLALIRIQAKGLTELHMADSATLEVGDFVVAIGNPFGLQQTVTYGIIGALGRSGLGIEGYENFIQTDASINPGNSGGALVDLRGELVGINTAIVGPSGGNVGIGFAIPSNMARTILTQLIEYGEMRRGQLGVLSQDITPELAEAMGLERPHGALISQILKDSPAARAGLKVGDVVVAVNGKPVDNATQLRNAIGLLRVNSEAELEVLRNGKRLTVTARIAEPRIEKVDAGRLSPKLAGAVLGPLAANHPLAGSVKGVEVMEIKPGSPAAIAGLRPGDIITSVNRQPVEDVNDVRRALRAGGPGILLNIRRGNGALFMVIR